MCYTLINKDLFDFLGIFLRRHFLTLLSVMLPEGKQIKPIRYHTNLKKTYLPNVKVVVDISMNNK